MSRIALYDRNPGWRCKVCGRGNDGLATQASYLPWHRHVPVRLSGRMLDRWERSGLKSAPFPRGPRGWWMRLVSHRFDGAMNRFMAAHGWSSRDGWGR